MFTSRFARMALLGILFAAGVWLLGRSARLAPESVARQQALAAYAPNTGSRLTSQEAWGPGPVSGVARPVPVDLRQIPPGRYDPHNQLDRWRRGEIDLDEREGIVSEARLTELQAASARLEPSNSLQVASASTDFSIQSLSTGASFDSIDFTECCGGGGNVPPDPELAVGPNHVIAVVNVAFEIYDKAGNNLVAPTTFASFMASDSNCTGVFDPNALYDEAADRFILGIDADGSYYCVAVSQSGDPTGGWNIYSFPTGNDFFDYPHAGVGQDALYMGANMFSCRGPFSCTFSESRVWALDKAAMYNGQTANYVSQGLPNSEDTPQPLNLHGWNQGTWPAGGPHYFFTNTDFNGATYSVWSWNDPFGGGSVNVVGTVDLQAHTGVSAGLPVDVPQSGGNDIQANDFRPQDFEYRDGYGWSVQTIACNPGSGTVDCIRWAQIDPATASVVDAGVYSSNGQYRFFGDLAVNACGDMAVGYTKSSNSTYPGIWYAGRQSGDPAGTLQAEAQLKAGELTYTAFDAAPHRWGDYTGMTIDPDGDTFWYLGQYSKDTGTSDGRWGTYVGSFSFGCEVGGEPTPTATPQDTPEPTATPQDTPTPTATPENTPAPTATPENTPTPTATPEDTPTPTATPGSSSTMHVADLDSTSDNNGRTWTANVAIRVVDGGGNPVSNANVSGSWSNGASGPASCTTGSNGACTVSESSIRKNVGSVTFTVDDVTHSSLTYDAGANGDPDGDSDGTTIIVSKP